MQGSHLGWQCWSVGDGGWVAAGWESKVQMSAPIPLSRLDQGSLLTAACRPGGGRSWEGYRHLGGSICRMVMPLALKSISLLCSFSWVLVQHSPLAAGRLARGRRAAGSCWDLKVSQVVDKLLLSSWSFCFHVFLCSYPMLSYSSAPEANGSCLFTSPGAEGLQSELMSVLLPILWAFPPLHLHHSLHLFPFCHPTTVSPFLFFFFFFFNFFPTLPCNLLLPLASTNSDSNPPGLLLLLLMFAPCLSFAPSPALCFSAALVFQHVPDLTEFEWEWWVRGSRRDRTESFWESIVSIKLFCLIFHLAVVLVSTSTHSRV